jgi:hypothetical protein
MVGKNPLWVAKQHGHSIATMLRAYAAWAEGTAEVDVEAIKRSMNASESPPSRNLAVNLSVAEALQTKRALAIRSPHRISSCANRLFRHRELAVNQTKKKLAGVAGFEPTNGGIKTRCLTTWRHPSISNSINPSRPAPAATRARGRHSAPVQRNSSSDPARAPRGAPRRSRWHRARRYRNPFRLAGLVQTFPASRALPRPRGIAHALLARSRSDRPPEKRRVL